MKIYDPLKWLIDRFVALVLLILLSPIFLIAIVAIRLESAGSALFWQERLGQHCRTFHILKLRTMTIDPNRKPSQTYSHSPGVTRVGGILRRLKIDELPQLFNILRGDMSLIGPRPALPQILNEIDDISRQRFLVRPGLTGWAQVNGNVSLSWPERWKYDVEYVKSRSLLLDCRIIVRTVQVVVLGEEYLQGRSKP